jgi:hypothetical protein
MKKCLHVPTHQVTFNVGHDASETITEGYNLPRQTTSPTITTTSHGAPFGYKMPPSSSLSHALSSPQSYQSLQSS